MTGIPVVQQEVEETIYLVMRDDGSGNGRNWRIQGDDALGWLLSKMLPQSSRVFVYRRETDGSLMNVSRNIRIEGGRIIIAMPKQETTEQKNV